jgi:hypothetical protein
MIFPCTESKALDKRLIQGYLIVKTSAAASKKNAYAVQKFATLLGIWIDQTRVTVAVFLKVAYLTCFHRVTAGAFLLQWFPQSELLAASLQYLVPRVEPSVVLPSQEQSISMQGA